MGLVQGHEFVGGAVRRPVERDPPDDVRVVDGRQPLGFGQGDPRSGQFHWGADDDIGRVLVDGLLGAASAGASLMFETSRDNRSMMYEAVRGLKRPVTSSAYVEVYRMMPNSSDMVPVLVGHPLTPTMPHRAT